MNDENDVYVIVNNWLARKGSEFPVPPVYIGHMLSGHTWRYATIAGMITVTIDRRGCAVSCSLGLGFSVDLYENTIEGRQNRSKKWFCQDCASKHRKTGWGKAPVFNTWEELFISHCLEGWLTWSRENIAPDKFAVISSLDDGMTTARIAKMEELSAGGKLYPGSGESWIKLSMFL